MSVVSGSTLPPVEYEPGLFAVKLIDGSRGAANLALLRGWLTPGASHSPHTHDAEEAVVFLSGRGVVTIGGRTFQVREGDALLIPPHVVHSTTNDDAGLTLHFIAAFSDAAIRSYPADPSSKHPFTIGRALRNRVRWYARQIWHRVSRA